MATDQPNLDRSGQAQLPVLEEYVQSEPQLPGEYDDYTGTPTSAPKGTPSQRLRKLSKTAKQFKPSAPTGNKFAGIKLPPGAVMTTHGPNGEPGKLFASTERMGAAPAGSRPSATAATPVNKSTGAPTKQAGPKAFSITDPSSWLVDRDPSTHLLSPTAIGHFAETYGDELGIGKDKLTDVLHNLREHPVATVWGLTPIVTALREGKRVFGELGEAGKHLYPTSPTTSAAEEIEGVRHAARAIPFVGPGLEEGAERISGELGDAYKAAAQGDGKKAAAHLAKAVPFFGPAAQKAGFSTNKSFSENLQIASDPRAMGHMFGAVTQAALAYDALLGAFGKSVRPAHRISPEGEVLPPEAAPAGGPETPGESVTIDGDFQAVPPDELTAGRPWLSAGQKQLGEGVQARSSKIAKTEAEVRADLSQVAPEDRATVLDAIRRQGIDAYQRGDMEAAQDAALHQHVMTEIMKEGQHAATQPGVPAHLQDAVREISEGMTRKQMLEELRLKPNDRTTKAQLVFKLAVQRANRATGGVVPAEGTVVPRGTSAPELRPEEAPEAGKQPAATAEPPAAVPEFAQPQTAAPLVPVAPPEAPAPEAAAPEAPPEAPLQVAAPAETPTVTDEAAGTGGYVNKVAQTLGVAKGRKGKKQAKPQEQEALPFGAEPQPAPVPEMPAPTPTSAAAEPEPETPAAAAAPAPAGAKARATSKQRKAADDFQKKIADHYTPGNVIYNKYWNSYDKVLEFNPTTEDRSWQVKVIHSDKDGNPTPGERPRWHSTPPDKGDKVIIQAAAPPPAPASAPPAPAPAAAPAEKKFTAEESEVSHTAARDRTLKENVAAAHGVASSYRDIPKIAINDDGMVMLDRIAGRNQFSNGLSIAANRVEQTIQDLRKLAQIDPQKYAGATLIADLIEKHRTPNGNVVLHRSAMPEEDINRILLEELFHDWQQQHKLASIAGAAAANKVMRAGPSAEAWKQVIKHLTDHGYRPVVAAIEAPAWVASGFDKFGINSEQAANLLGDYFKAVEGLRGADAVSKLPPIHDTLEKGVSDARNRRADTGKAPEDVSGRGAGRVDSLQPAQPPLPSGGAAAQPAVPAAPEVARAATKNPILKQLQNITMGELQGRVSTSQRLAQEALDEGRLEDVQRHRDDQFYWQNKLKAARQWEEQNAKPPEPAPAPPAPVPPAPAPVATAPEAAATAAGESVVVRKIPTYKLAPGAPTTWEVAGTNLLIERQGTGPYEVKDGRTLIGTGNDWAEAERIAQSHVDAQRSPALQAMKPGIKGHFEQDNFNERRASIVGAGNAYNPDSLMTGAELAKGMTPHNSYRDYASQEEYDRMASGHVPTEEILRLAPRRFKTGGMAELIPQSYPRHPKYAGQGGEGMVDVIHYSNNPDIEELDPAQWGANPLHDVTGQRVNRPDEARKNAYPEYWRPETYVGDPSHPEFRDKAAERHSVRQYTYRGSIPASQIYDMVNDPRGLREQSRQELLAKNKAKFNANIMPSAPAVEAYTIHKLKELGYTARRDVNGLIASWEKIPVKRTSISPSVDTLPENLRKPYKTFVSPNVFNLKDISEARRRVASLPHKLLQQESRWLLKELGTKIEPRTAIGVWKDGAENSLVHEWPVDADIDLARYHNAVMSKAAYQKAFYNFIHDRDGNDVMYRFTVPKSGGDTGKITDILGQHGLNASTIMKEYDGHAVLIGASAEENPETQEKITKAVEKLGGDDGQPIRVRSYRGRSEFVGDDDRDRAQEIFARFIAEREAVQPAWGDVRSRLESRLDFRELQRIVRSTEGQAPFAEVTANGRTYTFPTENIYDLRADPRNFREQVPEKTRQRGRTDAFLKNLIREKGYDAYIDPASGKAVVVREPKEEDIGDLASLKAKTRAKEQERLQDELAYFDPSVDLGGKRGAALVAADGKVAVGDYHVNMKGEVGYGEYRGERWEEPFLKDGGVRVRAHDGEVNIGFGKDDPETYERVRNVIDAIPSKRGAGDQIAMEYVAYRPDGVQSRAQSKFWTGSREEAIHKLDDWERGRDKPTPQYGSAAYFRDQWKGGYDLQSLKAEAKQRDPNTLKTDTPEFKEWFGDSKMVDRDGQPMVMYHGTGSGFSTFDKSEAGRNFPESAGQGFFFTNNTAHEATQNYKGDPSVYEDMSSAGSFANYDARNLRRAGKPAGANIMPVYLRIENPLVIEGDTQGKGVLRLIETPTRGAADLLKDAIATGHDGVIVRDLSKKMVGIGGRQRGDFYETVAGVADPSQIKSVFNRGTFDPESANILQSRKAQSQRPLHEMSISELDSALDEARGRDQADLVDLFGEEGAKRYKALDRKANSSTDPQGADRAADEMQEMESKLTKDQRDRLYGIGDTRHQADDLQEYRRALGQIDANSPDDLAESLKYAASRISDPGKPVEQMNPKERVAYAQLRHGFEIAQANGWDTEPIIKKAIRSAAGRWADPDDAMFMLEKVARSVAPGGKIAALQAEADRLKPEGAETLQSRKGPMGSTVPLMHAALLPRYKLVDDIAAHLEDHTRRAFDQLHPGDTSDEHRALVTRATRILRDELKYQMAQDNNGADWYKHDIRGDQNSLMAEMRKLHPELKDPTKERMFLLFTAATSPGKAAAFDDVNIGEQVYDLYKKNGGRPSSVPLRQPDGTPWGSKGNSPLKSAKAVLQYFHGNEQKAMDWLLAKHSLDELREVKAKAGFKTDTVLDALPPDYDPDQLYGAYVLGQKVGPFFLNLNGIATELTVDKWFMRTWNRLMGTLIGTDGRVMEVPRGPNERRAMIDSIGKLGKEFGLTSSQVQAALWYYEQGLYERFGQRGQFGGTYANAAKDVAHLRSQGFRSRGEAYGAGRDDAVRAPDGGRAGAAAGRIRGPDTEGEGEGSTGSLFGEFGDTSFDPGGFDLQSRMKALRAEARRRDPSLALAGR